MAIFQRLAAFGVRQLVDGAFSTVGLNAGADAVVGLLAARFTDHSRKLTVALETANERSWKALEIALAGDSFWDRCKVVLSSGDDKAFREQVRAFLDANPLSADSAGVRDVCLQELRTARKNKLLAGGSLDPKALAQQAGAFAGFADPQAVLTAEWQAVDHMAEELRQAGHANLAQLLSSRPPQGMPLLVVAVRYFFRRQVETDQELFHGLAFAQLERLGQSQDAGFAALDAALTQQGQRLDAMLGEIQSVVVETHGAVLDLQDQIEGQSEQVKQIGLDVQKLLEQHHLQRRELRPGDSLSIRNDNERQLVKQVVARYRALPEGDRKEVPSLLNAIGKLEVVAGDFDAAHKDFQAVALLEQNNKGQAEAHYNAYLASLEKRDWPGAIQELVKAIKLDGKRFAPFPVGKYHPMRILGAGGFGVAFLCKHKYMDAQVVVKTLALEDLGRDADKVFTEAQVLRQLEHPAIIRISECGYVDAAKKSRPYLLMDYFQGATLEEYVKKNGPLSADDLIAVGRQVADGLYAAHAKGILHRDVKPANLLIHKDEKGWKVKVIDFGLALRQKVVQKSTKPSTSRQRKTLIGESIAGTVDYAAPEQMGKREGVAPGPYSDVYGWAKTCCYALFQTTQPLMKHWQSLPTPLAELLEKCLDEDPAKRPQGFADVLAALDQMTANPAGATPPAWPAEERTFAFEEAVDEAPSRPAWRLPLMIGGGVALAAILAVVLLTVVLRVKTTAGTLVVEVDQPGAEVFVDGQRYTITRPGDKEPIQVEVQEGMRQLKVVKGGFETFTKEFTVKSGDKETIRVRLEPVAGAAIKTIKAPTAALPGQQPKPGEALKPVPIDERPKPDPAPTREELQDEIVNSFGMRLKRIKPGTFLMGSPKGEAGQFDNEGPQHSVEITRPFYLGVYPVTQAEYVQVTGQKNPSWFSKEGGGKSKVEGLDTSKFPVEQVSWDEAAAFCEALNRLDLKKPAGWKYALPTEAEWEYACRAGTKSAYFFGSDSKNLSNYAWYSVNSGSRPHAVGTRMANPWGLCDMNGNVWQWCADWYAKDYYASSPNKDPQCLINDSAQARVCRGGSWYVSAEFCRAADRHGYASGIRVNLLGLRVCFRLD
jgi:formylglycine-generating enzyme required for sulfatase activity/tetratricopeptide (TPR) repeat protein